MNVVWDEEASGQLEVIFEFLSRNSEGYARGLINRLASRADDLGDFPEIGRVVERYGNPRIRELTVSPYRLLSLIGSERIEILAVVPTGRQEE